VLDVAASWGKIRNSSHHGTNSKRLYFRSQVSHTHVCVPVCVHCFIYMFHTHPHITHAHMFFIWLALLAYKMFDRTFVGIYQLQFIINTFSPHHRVISYFGFSFNLYLWNWPSIRCCCCCCVTVANTVYRSETTASLTVLSTCYWSLQGTSPLRTENDMGHSRSYNLRKPLMSFTVACFGRTESFSAFLIHCLLNLTSISWIKTKH